MQKTGDGIPPYEINAEAGAWEPAEMKAPPARNVGDLLGVRMVGYELELREQVKRAGGIWRSRQQLWELAYGQILALGHCSAWPQP